MQKNLLKFYDGSGTQEGEEEEEAENRRSMILMMLEIWSKEKLISKDYPLSSLELSPPPTPPPPLFLTSPGNRKLTFLVLGLGLSGQVFDESTGKVIFFSLIEQ